MGLNRQWISHTMTAHTKRNLFYKYDFIKIEQQIEAYGEWLRNPLEHGWDAYFFTFEFNQLPGPPQEKSRLMKEYLQRWYGRLSTRTVRDPRSPKWSPSLPKAVLVPDYPVPKHHKKSLTQVSINDGLHYHGLVSATRTGTRLQHSLDVHMKENGTTYFTKELHHIDVKNITHDPEFITDYCMKALKGRVSMDEILIFPRTLSELPNKGPIRAAGEKPTYDFQRK
jgi:hypothetical protein